MLFLRFFFYRPIFFFNLKIITQRQLPRIMHCTTRFVIPFYQHFTRHQFAKRKDSRLIILLILHFISILLYKMHLSRESISHRKTRFEFRAFAFAFETQPWPGAKNSFCDSISSDWAGYRPIYCIFNGNFSKKEREWGNDRIDMRKSLWGGNPWSVIRSRPRHKAKSC